MSFRHLLKREFDTRRARNYRYSLRAFARSLRCDHSTLSQIMRGRRALTPGAVRQFATQLRITASETEHYCVEAAIIRLVHRASFRADSREIARRIGSTADDVNIVLQRLVRTQNLSMRGQQWVTP
ncbi:MAG: helix-turn-helix domain-containing protein [Thermoanaerobaculia bacterium]